MPLRAYATYAFVFDHGSGGIVWWRSTRELIRPGGGRNFMGRIQGGLCRGVLPGGRPDPQASGIHSPETERAFSYCLCQRVRQVEMLRPGLGGHRLPDGPPVCAWAGPEDT
ncbi:hypothetical protein SDJN03_18211, partial [Cucurbita argyrosperma subsp. sororia]